MLPITLDDIKYQKKYIESEIGNYLLNCHIGHIKLLCVILEFLIQCQKNNFDMNNLFIIYIGSAPGISLNIIDILYPNILWLLYDKNKFLINNTNNNFTFMHQYFEDDDIIEAKKLYIKSNRKHFIYICDMRADVSEEAIMNDMIKQQKWLIELNCDAYCLKMRLPYYLGDKYYDYELPKCFNTIPKKSINEILYINGTIHLQVFAPKRSTETRLMGFKPYELQVYNIKEYEGKCMYFNSHVRATTYSYKGSDKYLLYSEFDNVKEYYIYYNYNKLNHRFKHIYKLYRLINKKLITYHIVNSITCKLELISKLITWFIKSPRYDIEHKRLVINYMISEAKKIIKNINLKLKTSKEQYKNISIPINKYIK